MLGIVFTVMWIDLCWPISSLSCGLPCVKGMDFGQAMFTYYLFHLLLIITCFFHNIFTLPSACSLQLGRFFRALLCIVNIFLNCRNIDILFYILLFFPSLDILIHPSFASSWQRLRLTGKTNQISENDLLKYPFFKFGFNSFKQVWNEST